MAVPEVSPRVRCEVVIREAAADAGRDRGVRNVEFRQASVFDLPFADASFDVVLFCGMLEVSPKARKAAAIQEIARVLRPQGALYLTTQNRLYRRYRHHQGTVTYHELAALLRPHFDAVIRGFNPVPPFPYGIPNRVLARVPGIWQILMTLMEREVATTRCCAFLVMGTKRI